MNGDNPALTRIDFLGMYAAAAMLGAFLLACPDVAVILAVGLYETVGKLDL